MMSGWLVAEGKNCLLKPVVHSTMEGVLERVKFEMKFKVTKLVTVAD
jgi:hypothetical protein